MRRSFAKKGSSRGPHRRPASDSCAVATIPVAAGTPLGRKAPRSIRTVSSNLAAVIGPVQQSLTLTWPARWIARLAVLLYLRDMPPDCLPALDLTGVLLRHAAAHVVAAVPLEPAARIVGVNPAFITPDRQRLASVNTKIIYGAVAA